MDEIRGLMAVSKVDSIQQVGVEDPASSATIGMA
jgi:hypothetical protein